MKVLMLTPYLPYPLLSGGQIRTYNLLKKLSKHHEITLFALIKEEEEKQYIPELEKYCASVRVFKRSSKPFTLGNIVKTGFSRYPFLVMRNYVPGAVRAIREELDKGKYDLIHAETFYMMPHIPASPIPVILVEQTIEYLGYESFASRANLLLKPLLYYDIKKIRRWETHYWNLCHTLIAMSEDDRRYLAARVNDPDKVKVVENGVDTDWFMQKQRQETDKPTLLSVGTFKWLPNVEAVDFLVQKIWGLVKEKLPDARLLIVGNAPTKKVLGYQNSDSSIQVLGRVDDIRDYFSQAHVLVAPVFSGKGTRYKILEAMASGTPVVATSVAVEGLGVKGGKHVLISDTAQGMADAIVQLISDSSKRRQLAESGREFVRKNYDWSLISKKLDTIYQSINR